jgi:hypothetical protein
LLRSISDPFVRSALLTGNPCRLPKETDDNDDDYGPTGTRNIDKTIATNNADSYSWLANEALWSVICTKSYGDPQAPQDDDDPNCGGTVCKAA